MKEQDLDSKISNDSSLIVYPQKQEIKLSSSESEEPISSNSSIDCTSLQNLLAKKQWQQANQETATLLLKAANQERRNWLERNDVENISCRDLLIINQHWQDYSQGHFGFISQLNIWQNLELQNYQQFGYQVGWYHQRKWISIKHLDFTSAAPKGHLPAISWWFGHAIWGLKVLFSRLNSCLMEEINT